MASLPSAVVLGSTLPQLQKLTSSSLPFDKKNVSNGGHLEPVRHKPPPPQWVLGVQNGGGAGIEKSAYVPILEDCIQKGSVSEAQAIHAHMVKTGAHQDLFLMTFLVNVYAKCGDMPGARRVFDNLSKKNVVTWTSLMSGYIHNMQPEFAFRVFRQMLEVGKYPTNYTLAILLTACTTLDDIKLGTQIHGYIVKYSIDYDTSVGNALCSLYSKLGFLDSAIKSFKRIDDKNVISWTAAISACGDNGDSAMGIDLFVQMLIEGVVPNEFTLTSALSLCCLMQTSGLGTQVHSLSIKLGHQCNLPVTNSIMYLYLKTGGINEANKLFEGMEKGSLVTWNAMISGHAQMMDLAAEGLSAHSSGMEALKLFLRLNRTGMKPDLFTFSSVLTVCSNLAAMEQGEQVHAQTIKSGFLSDVVVGTALVNMYNKCGSIEGASKAFVEMPTRTMISWTAMITAFGQHGRSKQVLQLFEDMIFVGVKPNRITFVAILSACSHAGMVDEALAFFDLMKNEYKMKPVMDHYACLIDMFVRLGQIEEAFDLIKKMEFEPSEFIWSTLIAGCRSHGKLELGYHAAEKLLDLKPKDSETYLWLLNMYLSGGRWKDVSRVRKMMKDEKMGKVRDWSWISIRDEVYSFKPRKQVVHSGGDEEVDKLLLELHERAKGLGYEWPQTTSIEVLEEEGDDEQEEASAASSSSSSIDVYYHSEKVAVAFGLLNVREPAPIRVTKSISMCRECHSFIKLISALSDRTIIVRDSKRLHKFVNGGCSCGDFSSLVC